MCGAAQLRQCSGCAGGSGRLRAYARGGSERADVLFWLGVGHFSGCGAVLRTAVKGGCAGGVGGWGWGQREPAEGLVGAKVRTWMELRATVGWWRRDNIVRTIS
eukprot:scaffold25771_cov62-Phaeocystis_antarctica.AAC.3